MKTVKWWNKKWRSFVNSKDFNPKKRWNVTLCGKLRWIPPQTVSAAIFVPAKVIKKKKKKKTIQTPSNYQSKIQSCMCWFQDKFKKYMPNVRSKSNSKKVQLLKMELSLRSTECCWQSTSKSWRERLLYEGDCWNFHAEKIGCHNNYVVKRSREDKRKL